VVNAVQHKVDFCGDAAKGNFLRDEDVGALMTEWRAREILGAWITIEGHLWCCGRLDWRPRTLPSLAGSFLPIELIAVAWWVVNMAG